MELTADAMHKLAELFRVPEPEVLQGSDLKSTEIEISSTRNEEAPAQDSTKQGPRNLEEYEEQQAKEAELLAHAGGGVGDRKTPEYTMNYQQAVSAEDVFLQIGHKTPSSASCEHLLVKIKMPGDKMENVDLSVDKSSITVNSSQFHLILPLPHRIDPDASKANWDRQLETLILTLKLEREFDYVNF